MENMHRGFTDRIPQGMQFQLDSVPGEMSEDVLQVAEKFKNLSTPIVIIASKTFVLYVIGTNHAIPQCQDDVAFVINEVKPKTVVLELCASRICGCTTHRNSIFQTKPEFSYSYLKKAMKQIGTIPGMIFFADVYKERQIAEQVYLDYGGEMIRAIMEARNLGIDITLGDRPIEITLQRQANALSYWKKLQLMIQVSLAMKLKHWKSWFLLKASRVVFQDEKAFQVLVLERDMFLTYVLQATVSKRYTDLEKTPVIAVVGQGHLHGIVSFWGRMTPQAMQFITSTNEPV